VASSATETPTAAGASPLDQDIATAFASGKSSIQKYVALRDLLLRIHGPIAPGSHLPRLTAADKFVVGGIMLACTANAIGKQLPADRPMAYSWPTFFDDAGIGHAGMLAICAMSDPPLVAAKLTARSDSPIPNADDGVWDATGVYQKRLDEWVAGEATTSVLRRKVPTPAIGQPKRMVDWYVISKSAAASAAVGKIMALWEPFWSDVKAPAISGGFGLLSVDEVTVFFGKLYDLAAGLPAASLHWDTTTVDTVWDKTKEGAKEVIHEAAKDVGETAAWAADQAGAALGTGLSHFLSSVGIYGLVLVIGVIYLRSAGVL
jgi:hypothetical protein